MENVTVTAEELNAIVGGYHADPFRALGRHGQDDGYVVRVFEPSAQRVSVWVDDAEFVLERVHEGGIFAGSVDSDKPYVLEITYDTGLVVRRADAYAFPSTLGPLDLHLHGEGTDLRIFDKLGAHIMKVDGVVGTRFAVWAPNALRVSLVGNFNQWDGRRNPMRLHPGTGIWELFIPNIGHGELYKYEIKTDYQDYTVLKCDPVGFYSEIRPNTASIVWDISKYKWGDKKWLKNRKKTQHIDAPISVYELHLGSWQRGNNNEWLSYEEVADRLIPYLEYMEYTHIELLPITEHPFDGSWGYQVTGYFAPTSRFGTPEGFMYLVDRCHQAGIGVILDWVPAHFPKDSFGLGFFDGTYLYEHADPRRGEQPDWGTLIFNFDRNEVRQFLINSALFWIEKYHIDGLRVDAVASMLYLDFSRENGEWLPNQYGGRENIGAINFLREFNDKLHQQFPDVLTIAEESTSWGGVTAPTANGGLGFDLKWNMGWMHDTLQYMSTDPIYRAYHHGTVTFSMLYAFSERFMLPFSHDEVVHLKKSMLGKMPGDDWQKFANLRVLYGYMFSHPGKKLNFMGNEFGQWREWTEAFSSDWHLVQDGWPHQQLQVLVKRLNHLYCSEPALYLVEDSWEGFEWLEIQDSQNSVLAYLRKAGDEHIVVVLNFTPVVRHHYRIGVPVAGAYEEILNTDDAMFGGSGVVNGEKISDAQPWQNQSHSITVDLPPLGCLFFKLRSD